jgi:hypothetical protein
MSRRWSVRFLAALAVLAFLLPVTAGIAVAKDSSNFIKTEVELLNPATLNGIQLRAGTYELTADGSKLTLSKNGKVVAMAAMTWKEDGSKSPSTSVVVTDNAVQEIHFSGKTRYVAIAR